MSYCIILRGPAASGKTTIALRLQQELGAHHICIDQIKKRLGLKHSEQEKLQANTIALQEAKEHLAKGRVVIFEEVFYYASQLSGLVAQLPVPHKIFSLYAPAELCVQRNIQRRKAGLRNMSDEDVKLVHELVSRVAYGIPVATSGVTVDETLSTILSHLT